MHYGSRSRELRCPDIGVPENGCHNACTGYCEFSEIRCQLPCSLDHCIGVCDQSNGDLVNGIIAQSQMGTANCSQIIAGRDEANGTPNVQTNYSNLAVSCTEFCQDLGAYLTDRNDGAGQVCGEFLECDQAACVNACEIDSLDFAQNLGAPKFWAKSRESISHALTHAAWSHSKNSPQT